MERVEEVGSGEWEGGCFWRVGEGGEKVESVKGWRGVEKGGERVVGRCRE